MPANFFDTNVLVYAASRDAAKGDRADQILRQGGVISVQVLNELLNVLRRKFRLDWPVVNGIMVEVRSLLNVVPVTLAVHEAGVMLSRRYGFSVYDSMVVAAAVQAGCTTLWSEDMQDGMEVEGVQIVNPFRVR
jgi:predicted nucleic acid-binding protein